LFQRFRSFEAGHGEPASFGAQLEIARAPRNHGDLVLVPERDDRHVALEQASKALVRLAALRRIADARGGVELGARLR
jgi:hypothetical protein